jgi:riboflavin kinase/FMN adenylyltransferase
MKYIAGNTNFKLKNTAVTLGKFDGLHLGHQLLLDQVKAYKNQGYTTVMFSFLYHPCNLFSEKEFELIYTEEEKKTKLKKSGLDVLISYPFTQETRSIEPEAFIKDILVDRLDAKAIVVGSDFHFGYERRGDVRLLKKFEKTYGYKVIVCEKKKSSEGIISSSLIRNELKEGNIEAANAMLGQPYTITGEVMHGRRIGRTLGMPTTNIIPAQNKLLPPNGVYASKTLIDGISHPGVTNIGYKPTVGGEEKRGVETFLFDFDQDLYGRVIEVSLYTYVRPENKFDSLEKLRLQMLQDIKAASDYFKADNNR